MSWRESTPMKERRSFIEEYRNKEHSVAELCRRFGISRKTGYKWIARFREEGGDEGLEVELADRSRRPRANPRAIEPWLVDAIVTSRKQRPNWGPKKLRAVLVKRNPVLDFPSVSTFAAIFKRHGLVRPRRRRGRTPPYSAPFAAASGPNKLWCVDFKGQFSVGNVKCYPLTVTDAYSRYLIACVGMRRPRGPAVRRAFEEIFNAFGLPDAIRSDNGPPFAARGPGGFSKLSVWWLKLGIRHERITPGKPQQNGRHERMHLTLKQETASPPEMTMATQQKVFDRFRKRFNEERPHEALGQEVPATHYEPSRRRLPIPRSGRDFPYDSGTETVRVSRLGYARVLGGSFFVSTTLKHELLGIEPLATSGWAVHFGPVFIGRLDRAPRSRRVRFTPAAEVSPMSVDKVSPMSAE